MRVDLFDFALPEDRIAAHPAHPRDSARMLRVTAENFEDKTVRDLPGYLHSGDVLVLNDTKVIPARLLGKRGEAKVELLLLKPFGSPLEGEQVRASDSDARTVGGGNSFLLPPTTRLPPSLKLRRTSRLVRSPSRGELKTERWTAFAKPAKRLKVGDVVQIADDFVARIIEKKEDGEVVVAFNLPPEEFHAKLLKYGHTPLPPYIRREDGAADRTDYQTCYAREEGSVAAPTAGLHFTEALLDTMRQNGVNIAHVTLHVGAGTFLPVKAEDTHDHKMHSEWGEVSGETAAIVNQAKAKGSRIVAVGTTSLRLLETAADDSGQLHPWQGDTNIFITPGYRFKLVDRLMTNFHLPRSTLFMLVSAFAGTERMKAAYAHAIASGYRFYSYGDACLLEQCTDSLVIPHKPS